MHLALVAALRTGDERGSDVAALAAARQRRVHRPEHIGPGRLRRLARVLGKGCAAKTAARREERDRFEQIGLARAVRPGEHDRPAAQFHFGARIGAEVREPEPRHMQRGSVRSFRLMERVIQRDSILKN
jgi:hypothetical protein